MATAALLPPARSVFFDSNGNPLSGGLVFTLVPGGTTPATTWQDPAETIPNTNPIVLDAAGSCLLYGSGIYQLTVTDSWGNAVPAYSGITSSLGEISAAMAPVVGATTVAAAYELLADAFATANNVALPYIVPTMAALRALPAVFNNLIYVIGYTTPADGGGGFFAYVASDTTTADNGGTIIVDAGQHRWYREMGGLPYSFEWFGAVNDGTADSPTDNTISITNCLNAAVAAGAAAYCPSGSFLISRIPTIPGILTLIGDGKLASVIVTNTTTGDVLTLTGQQGEISGIQFTAKAQRASGAYLNWGAVSGNVTDCFFDFYADAISASGNVGSIKDCWFQNPTPASGNGVIISGYAGGILIDNLLMFAPPAAPNAGILIVNAGDVQIDNCSILSQNNCLEIAPGNGQSVAAVFATNTFFDTAQANGAIISPVAGSNGNIVRCHFIGCWFSSAGQNGVSIGNPGTGTVSGIDFDSCMMVLNGANGLAVDGGTAINVHGGVYGGNGAVGIIYQAGVTSFSVIGVATGAYDGVGGNGQFGVAVEAGPSDDYIISLCRLAGNVVGGISDGGSGANKFVGNNIA